MYGAFEWARRALNRQKRRFPARAVLIVKEALAGGDSARDAVLERLALVEREFDRGEGASPAPRGYDGGSAEAGPREITLMVVRGALVAAPCKLRLPAVHSWADLEAQLRADAKLGPMLAEGGAAAGGLALRVWHAQLERFLPALALADVPGRCKVEVVRGAAEREELRRFALGPYL